MFNEGFDILLLHVGFLIECFMGYVRDHGGYFSLKASSMISDGIGFAYRNGGLDFHRFVFRFISSG